MPFYFDSHGNLRLKELDEWPWVVHGFSTRLAGSLSQAENQRHFIQTLGGDGMKLVTLRQIHSAIIRVAEGGAPAGQRGDSLIAAQPGTLLGIKTADCLPVLVVDSRRRVVAAVHGGWRGLAKRVVEKTVGEMRRSFQCDPEDLVAVIGPGIQACCFEVGPEVLEEFRSQFVDAGRFCRADPLNPALAVVPRQVMTGAQGQLDATRGHVDLAEVARHQLLSAGVPEGQVHNAGLCTACDLDRFYSYRREKEAAGRMLAVIGLRPPDR